MPSKNAVRRKRYAQKLRRAVVAFLGGKCARCGFDDPRALQVDHVNGGGQIEQRRIGADGIYRRILKGIEGYQLLCANCNWIKRSENNESGGQPCHPPK